MVRNSRYLHHSTRLPSSSQPTTITAPTYHQPWGSNKVSTITSIHRRTMASILSSTTIALRQTNGGSGFFESTLWSMGKRRIAGSNANWWTINHSRQSGESLLPYRTAPETMFVTFGRRKTVLESCFFGRIKFASIKVIRMNERTR